MNRIDCFSVNDKNGLNRVYMLLNSLKLTKQKDTVINYRLILEDLTEETKQYFADLQSEDFNIQFIDIDWFKQRIHLPEKDFKVPANYYTMVRCLCPAYFKQVDRMLYLDTDMVFLQGGVEELWNTNIDQYYIAGVEDIMIMHWQQMKFEKENTKNETAYINAGMTLMNFKLIREVGLDKELVEWCQNWKNDELKPHWLDQTLLNYLFRGKIKLLDFKYNDYSLVISSAVMNIVKKHLKQLYDYDEPVNSVKDAVIIHFLGDLKPWKEQKQIKYYFCYPYRTAAKKIWQNLEKALKKNEQKESKKELY